MTVYLDLVAALNFAVDFLLLLGTNRLAGFPPGVKRCSAAAALGACYAVSSLLPGFSFLGGNLWRLIFLLLMGLTAFGMHESALRRTGIFLLLSLAMGGVTLGMERRTVPMLLLAAGGIWLLSRAGFGKTVGGRVYVPVSITREGRSVSVIALRDTGNSLRDPITGEQILVLGPKAGEKLLGMSPSQLLNPMETLLQFPGMGLQLVPFRSLGCSGGLLLAKRFANVRIGEKTIGALVAFAPEQIGTGEIYQALAGGMI